MSEPTALPTGSIALGGTVVARVHENMLYAGDDLTELLGCATCGRPMAAAMLQIGPDGIRHQECAPELSEES